MQPRHLPLYLLVVAACGGEAVAPPTGTTSDQFSSLAVTLQIDARTGAVSRPPAADLRSDNSPSFALVGHNEIDVLLTGCTRSPASASRVRIACEAAVENRLQGAQLVTPTFPPPPSGPAGILLLPYRVIPIGGSGGASSSSDWDGAPHSFFNDASCSTKPESDCYRWERFATPLRAGATSERRTIGFEVGSNVLAILVQFVAAADIEDDQPAPAPRIAFSSARGGNWDIWTMTPDGSDQQPLMSDPEPDVSPAWSPDRTRLAFQRNDQIWVINADGTGMTQLSTAGGVGPAWSPDGTKIAYASAEGGEDNVVIYVMNADGSNHIRITLDPNGWAHLDPDWSPDGSRIVFSRQSVFPFAEIWAVNADGSNLVRIGRAASSQRLEYSPAWSPDGTRIAFNADSVDDFLQPVERRLMSMDPNGASAATIFLGKAFAPAWSPDGSRISYYTTDADNVTDQVFSIAADGSDAVQLTAVGRNSSPAWR